MKSVMVAGLVWLLLCGSAGAVDIEEVNFSSGGIDLYAEIHLPGDGEELPGIVLIQGAGASGVDNQWARLFATAFAGRGYAVLLPDKRGVGQSAGDWRTAGFDDLAADAIASLRALERHPRVAAGRVGFMGLSQGGHISPIAGLQVANIPFVINVVGSLTTMEDQLIHELANTYRQHGLDEETVRYLQTLTTLSFEYLRDASKWDAYLARRTEIADGQWSRAAESWPETRDDDYWTFWDKIYADDPMLHWRALSVERDVPCLVLLGAEDEHDNVPVADSVERARPLVDEEDFTIRVYEGSGHGLFAPGTRSLRPDMIEYTDRWLHAALDRRGDDHD